MEILNCSICFKFTFYSTGVSLVSISLDIAPLIVLRARTAFSYFQYHFEMNFLCSKPCLGSEIITQYLDRTKKLLATIELWINFYATLGYTEHNVLKCIILTYDNHLVLDKLRTDTVHSQVRVFEAEMSVNPHCH